MASYAKLRASLASLGVGLGARFDGGALRLSVKTPPGTLLPPKVRAGVAEHRDELLAERLDAHPPGAPDVSGPDRRPVWRALVAGWGVDRRLRWGTLANRLEARGVPFPASEARAFAAVADPDDWALLARWPEGRMHPEAWREAVDRWPRAARLEFATLAATLRGEGMHPLEAAHGAFWDVSERLAMNPESLAPEPSPPFAESFQ